MNDSTSPEPVESSEPSGLPSLAKSAKLGSLSQSARKKKLKQARGILLLIGILTILVNGLSFVLAEDSVQSAIEAEMRSADPNLVVDEAKVQEFKAATVRSIQLVSGGMVFVGALFIFFGVVIQRFPIPATVISLILYVCLSAIFAVLNPESINMIAALIRIVFIIALIQAVLAAVAYQREKTAEAGAEPVTL